MVKIIFLTLLLISSTTLAESRHVITPGVWPENIKQINGKRNSSTVIFSSRSVTVETRQLLKQKTIDIDNNTVLYASSTTLVRAKPKIYTHPELADEVERFYKQGVGNYAFWATLIGVAAAIQ